MHRGNEDGVGDAAFDAVLLNLARGDSEHAAARLDVLLNAARGDSEHGGSQIGRCASRVRDVPCLPSAPSLPNPPEPDAAIT